MSKPDQYYPDGFCGGSELPDDLWLDRMVYPERQPPPDLQAWPFGMSREEWEAEQERATAAREADRLREDRQFAITLDNATGVHTGPPRTVK